MYCESDGCRSRYPRLKPKANVANWQPIIASP
jgi:hypothetical protein